MERAECERLAQDLASRFTNELTGVYKSITVHVTGGESDKVTVTHRERQGLTTTKQSFLASLMAGTSFDPEYSDMRGC